MTAFVQDATLRVGADITQFRRNLAVARGVAANFSRDLNALGARLATAGATLGAGIGLAARDFARLDDELRAVRGITGASQSDFEALEQTVRQLGATTSFTAQEVGGAAKALARGGQDIAQIQSVLADTLNLARGTQVDLDFAAATVVRTLGQFNLEVEESARVVDVLAKAANSGTFDLEDLSESLKFLGPIANSLGFEVEETAAAFAVLANNNLRGGIAGRQLRRALFELTNQQKLQRLESELGVRGIVDQNGEFGSFEQTIRRVAEGLRDLPSATRINIVEEIFGEGAAAVESLVKNVDDLNVTLGELQVAEGSAAELARIIDDGLGGAFRIAVSAARDLSIELGNIFSQDLISLLDTIRELANNAATWARSNQELVKTVVALSAALLSGGALLIAFGAALASANVIAGALGATVGALTLTFSPLAIAIGAAVVALVALVGGLDEVQNAVRSTVGLIVSSFLEAGNAIGETRSQVDGLISSLTELNQLQGEGPLDPKQLSEASALVAALERKYGDLGIAVNEAAGRVDGLSEGLENARAIRALGNIEEQLKKLRGELSANVAESTELSRRLGDQISIGSTLLGGDIAGENRERELQDQRRSILSSIRFFNNLRNQREDQLNAAGIDFERILSGETEQAPPPVTDLDAQRTAGRRQRDRDVARSAGQLLDFVLNGVFNRAREQIQQFGADADIGSILTRGFEDVFRAENLQDGFASFGSFLRLAGEQANAFAVQTGQAIDEIQRQALEDRSNRLAGQFSSIRDSLRPDDISGFGTQFASSRAAEQTFDVLGNIRDEAERSNELLELIRNFLRNNPGFPVR